MQHWSTPTPVFNKIVIPQQNTQTTSTEVTKTFASQWNVLFMITDINCEKSSILQKSFFNKILLLAINQIKY